MIPTNMPVKRTDHPDVVFKTAAGKFDGLVEDIRETHAKGQPILVGTTSVEKSEYLSARLNREGITHKVLNARYHEKEAEIVYHAGEKGMVTIATNMPPRHGHQIGGRRRNWRLKDLGRNAMRPDGSIISSEAGPAVRLIRESRFYISLDDLMRFSAANSRKVSSPGLGDDEAIESRMVPRHRECPEKVEGNNFDSRKTLLL